MDLTKKWVAHLRENHQKDVSFCPVCSRCSDADAFRVHLHADHNTHASCNSDEAIDDAFRSMKSTEPRPETQHTHRPRKRCVSGTLDDQDILPDTDCSISILKESECRPYKKRSSPESGGDPRDFSTPLASRFRSRARVHDPMDNFNRGPTKPVGRQLWTDSDPQEVPQGRSAPSVCRSRPAQASPSLRTEERKSLPESMLQPETKPITQEQLVAEVKGIYAGLVMVETKCIEVDNAQSSNSDATKLNNEQWQALIALHRTLLHEHHDFFLASQHPSASMPLRRLASKYAMPARMWRHGIHSFLELLRHQLPESLEHMLTFLYLSYSMMALLYETVPAFEDTWIECLGDLGRYRMAIEDDDIKDREIWTGVSRHWYSKSSDKSPTTGRLYHHLAILARPNALQQLYYYAKSLCIPIPFLSARESAISLFDPPLDAGSSSPHLSRLDKPFVRPHGTLFSGKRNDSVDHSVEEFLEPLDGNSSRALKRWLEAAYFMASANARSLLVYGSESNVLLRAISHELDTANIPMDGTYAPEPNLDNSVKHRHKIIAFYLSSKRTFHAICEQNICQPSRLWCANHSFDHDIGQFLNHDDTEPLFDSGLPRRGLPSVFLGLIWLLIWMLTLAGLASSWRGGGETKRVSNFRRYLKRWRIDGHGLGIPLRTKPM